MAPKRSTPLDDPPSASSDDDETEDEQVQQHITHPINQQSSSSSEEEEEEEEDESEEETIGAVKNPPKILKLNSKSVESSSEGEPESESESEETTPSPVKTSIEKSKTLTPKSSSMFDSDSDLKSPNASDFAIKPSKKINALETPEKTPISKRPLSSESDVNNKKKMKVSNGDVDDEKKSVIKRVWSDDDELLLLQKFIDYQSKKGRSPLSDMDAFYRFTMDSLPGNASKSQLYEKIRRLKKKFLVNSEKASANGEDPVFVKSHERKLFEISKKIWGIDGCESVSGAKPKIRNSKVIKPRIEVKEEDEDDEDDEVMTKIEDFETLYPHWSVGLESEVSSSLKFPGGVITLIKKHLSSIGEAKAKEMDEKWEAVLEEEALLRRKRIELLGTVETSLGK